MGLFDTSGDDNAGSGFNNIAYAINVPNTLSQQPDMLDSIGDAVTKFVPLTALSIANSFYNTAVETANFFGADIAPVKAEDELKSMGLDSYENYYTQHQQGIEAAGLIAGSFIPGGLAIKAVKAIQGGRIGIAAARATNLLMPATKDVIKGAEATILQGNSAVFPSLAADKYKAIAFGVRDQFVQNIAFETATLATMNQSPLLSDQSWDNMTSDSLYGLAFATGIGGLAEGYSIYSKFQRAYIAADKATKASDAVQVLFGNNEKTLNGAPVAGDKAAALVDIFWDIPVIPDNNLSARKASTNYNNSVNAARMATRALTSPDNEPFADALFNMILKGRNENMTKEQAINKLAMLRYIQPVGDSVLVLPTKDVFFVNKFINPSEIPTLNNLLSVAAVDNADVSRRFTMRETAATGPKLGRYDDTFTTHNGQEIPRYNTAQEAFDDGMDLYINRKHEISVNPSAPNIKEVPLEGFDRVLKPAEARVFSQTGMLPKDAAPLFSAPTILNVKTGAFVTDAVKSLGDYAGPDAVRVRDNGVNFGQNEFSLQTASKPMDASTPTTDAQARYLWWDRRGIRNGDIIADGNATVGATADLPALEAMYNEATKSGDEAQYFASLKTKGVTFESGDALPADSAQLLKKIQIAKDDFIRDSLSVNPNMSAEEIARRANVSPDYIQNHFQTSTPTDFMQPHSNISDINHVQLSYDVGNTARVNGNLVTGMQAVYYRMQLLQDAANTQLARFFGPTWENFTISKYKSTDTTMKGVKPGFLSFSNAEYGTPENRVEFMGRNVEAFAQKTNDADQRTLSPYLMALRSDRDAAAELHAFMAARHMTGENYTFLPPELAAKYMPDAVNPENIAVLTKSLVKDKRGNILDWNSGYLPEGFFPGATKATMATTALGPHPVGLKSFYELGDKVADFERAWQGINDRNVQFRNQWYAAQGLERELPVGNIYAPPIDTSKYPYIAVVKPKAGTAFADGSTAVITAATAEGLEQKVGLLRSDFDVFSKDEIKAHFQIQGEYDYSRNFNTGLANGAMARRGILNDIFPNVNIEASIKDYVDFNRRQNYGLIRDHVELGSDQFFSELRAIGKSYESIGTSKVDWWANKFEKSSLNPYDSYINTALAKRDTESYPLWRDAQERVEAFASSAFNTAKSAFISVQKGLLSYDEASALNERMGLGNPYGKAVDAIKAYQDIANQLPPTRVLSKFVNAMNAIQATTAIRLDAFQSLINIVGAPIMQLSEMYSLKKQLAISIPGTPGATMPSVIKVFAQSIGDLFNSSMREQWMPFLKENGIIKTYIGDYFKLVDEETLPIGAANTGIEKIQNSIINATNMAAKLTGSQLSEDTIRYLAAMSAKRMFEKAGITGPELLDNITTFVNRIHGNYVASQRPIAFSGPVGAAMTLFQTYQVNLFQQILRHVADGDKKTLALFGALQGGIFGLQGLPGVQFVNQHLVANAAMNPAHKDIYSTTMNAMGDELGDWLLYGSVSNIMRTGLYSRGDINPRSLSIIPTNPTDFPAISGALTFLGNLYNVTQKLSNGGELWDTFTQGLEHNGLSRPLSGIGQMMQGYASTSTGKLVALTNPNFNDTSTGWADLQTAANFARRFAGARPLDEAVSMDTLFRSQAYEARDRTRAEELGAAFKTYAVGNKPIPEGVVSDMATKYAAAGGWMPNFGKSVVEWTKDANIARANEIFMHLAKPLQQQMQMSMGGRRLPDYATTPDLSNASTAAPTTGAP